MPASPAARRSPPSGLSSTAQLSSRIPAPSGASRGPARVIWGPTTSCGTVAGRWATSSGRSGNSKWPCPVCSRLVNLDHFLQKRHVKAVWAALDQANKMLGEPTGTYTTEVYGFYELWAFKSCQPALDLPCTAAISLLDGASFLLAHGCKEDCVGRDGWVTFLPNARAPDSGPPARVSHDTFKLALLARPARRAPHQRSRAYAGRLMPPAPSPSADFILRRVPHPRVVRVVSCGRYKGPRALPQSADFILRRTLGWSG